MKSRFIISEEEIQFIKEKKDDIKDITKKVLKTILKSIQEQKNN